jgi:glycosyltransferase involved in cell wall biosynthesis
MELEVVAPEKPAVKFEADPLISFIVPVHAGHLDKSVFKRCLMSLDDQDYENFEVVIVLNGGEDKALEDTAAFYVNKDKRFRLIHSEAGACVARNAGFEASKGEIVSFFNSDYRLKPGMARLWVDTLVQNPDYGFAYGGYEYATAPLHAYYSRKFDPFLLEVFNYIDCGFPLWRKYVVKWDPDVKSLQDWDFWLRVVKTHNVKGYFIDRDLTFTAEPPRPGGLSMDSSQNWLDRVRFVKEKNGIPMPDLLVTSVGAEFHGIQIAKMLGADYRDMSTLHKPSEYKAVYLIGFYMKPTDPTNDHSRILASFPKEVKRIIHFVGADIYWLRKFPHDSMRLLSGVLKESGAIILSENERAQYELKQFNIDSQILPIPPYNDFEVRPLPETYKVALYLTDKSDFDKYAQAHTLSIVRAMPDVEFSGYGDGAKGYTAPNFKHHGNMDLAKYKDFVYEHSAVLRLVRHDTLPMAACDFFLAGRHVISNIPMKYAARIDTAGTDAMTDWDLYGPGFSDTRWPDTKKQVVQAIRELKKQGARMPNEQHAHWADVLDRQRYIDTIRGFFK